MFSKKKIYIVSLIIVSFILMISSMVFFMSQVHNERQIDPVELESMTREQIIQEIYAKQQKENLPFFYFVPMFAFFGIAIGAVIYYVLGGDLEKKEKVIEHNTDVILNLLGPEERVVIKKIVENSGKIQQVEITYMDGFTKVRSHRVIESLVSKGILSKETLGKMRLITMKPEFYQILKKKEKV